MGLLEAMSWRKLALPMWRFVDPPRPQRTSLEWGEGMSFSLGGSAVVGGVLALGGVAAVVGCVGAGRF